MQLLIFSLLIVITNSQSGDQSNIDFFRNFFLNQGATTVPPTTLPPTTIPPTTIPPTTLSPTTIPPTTSSPIKFEQMTRRPVDPNNLIDKDGQSCKCVPYYYCNTQNEIDSKEFSRTSGYNLLDPRFDDMTCQTSIEVCCTNPKTDQEKPNPDPNKVKKCGYRNPGGIGAKFNYNQYSQFGEFPWVVVIQDTNKTYLGVGALIHPEVVVTGAHVVRNYVYAASRLKVRAGEWDSQTIQEIYDHEDRIVRDLYLHNAFVTRTLHNNIALLRLDRAIQIAEHINVICLPEQDEVFDSHKNCVANGWGKDVFGLEGRYAVIMKKLEFDMVSRLRCNSLLKRTILGPFFRLPDSLICAGGEEGKDTCEGDGGAPLVCPLGDNRYKLTGLVAGGVGCGQKDVPGVYTKVSKFRRWIDNKMAAWNLQLPTP